MESQEQVLACEIALNTEDDFLKIKETLTRIGVSSAKEKILYQSCHILHKRKRYYIVHFKELFALDKKSFDMSEEDIQRRNNIAMLLEEWNLCKILSPDIKDTQRTNMFKVISYKEKGDWILTQKYNIGVKKRRE